MQNVDMKVIGRKLVIEVDLDQDFGLSTSGKTHTVAKSGFAKVEGEGVPPGFGFNLNAWKAKPGGK